MLAPHQKIAQRPAESAAGLGGVIFLIGRFFGWDADVTNQDGASVAAYDVLTLVAKDWPPP